MKKIIYPCMAVAAMLSLASCSSDDVASDLAGDGVTVTLRLPSGLDSKATFGDQTTVTLDELKYTVFEGTGDDAVFAFSSLGRQAFGADKYTETETIKLGKGKDYTIVFYADQKGNGFVTFTDGNISVNYDGLSSNEEKYDAFYAVVEVPSGTATVTATLTRPFSQLNWGTDDLAEKAVTAKLDGLTATVKVTNGLYTGMNLLTGEVTGDAVADAVTFSPANVVVPTDTDTPNFPVTGYDLLAMNYLLTGDGTIDCELAFSNGFSPVTVSAAPVKTNYRTNIYGSLLTNPVNFNITVNPAFEGNVSLWDSSQDELDALIAQGGTIAVNKPVEKIDLTGYSAAKPLTLILNEPVNTIYLKDFSQLVTVKVSKDVAYPAFKNKTTTGMNGGPSVLKNFTLEGDITSSATCPQLRLYPIGQGTENVTIKNVRFDGNNLHLDDNRNGSAIVNAACVNTNINFSFGYICVDYQCYNYVPLY